MASMVSSTKSSTSSSALSTASVRTFSAVLSTFLSEDESSTQVLERRPAKAKKRISSTAMNCFFPVFLSGSDDMGLSILLPYCKKHDGFVVKPRADFFFVVKLSSNGGLFSIRVKTVQRNILSQNFHNRFDLIFRPLAKQFLPSDAVKHQGKPWLRSLFFKISHE